MEEKYTTRGVIFIHSVPPATAVHVEDTISAILGYSPNFTWVSQPVLPSFYRSEFSWTGEIGTASQLASALRGWEHLRFEITEDPTPATDGTRYS